MLHGITGWMQQKLELMNRNWQVDNFSMFLKGKHGFYNGGKTEKIEIPFLVRKTDQYWSRVYQKMQNSNIWGGMFPKKSWFCQYFHEIFMILNFWDYNGAPLYSQKSKIINISCKYWQNQLFLGNIPPKMLLFCIFCYTLDQYWSIFLAKNGISNFSIVPPIIKSMLSLYKLWKIVDLTISVH